MAAAQEASSKHAMRNRLFKCPVVLCNLGNTVMRCVRSFKKRLSRLYFTLTFMTLRAAAGAWVALLSIVLAASNFSDAATNPSPNIVLITLDSTRADRMGFFGTKPSLTPNMDRIAGESMVFEHAYAQSPCSVVSHATILTGAYPQATGMSEIGGTLHATLPYLPELLKVKGYHTAAFVNSAKLDARSGLAQGFGRGFEIYDIGNRLHAVSGKHQSAKVEAGREEVVRRALAWLEQNKQAQFFLWIHLGDSRPAGVAYNSSIGSSDAAVGKIIAALQQQNVGSGGPPVRASSGERAYPLYDKTAVIIVAAEGESLGAHGEDTHGIFLYDETIHVPLILKLPLTQAESKRRASRVSAKARLVDIAPSILEIAGAPVPSQMPGQSLLRIAKSGADQAVFSQSDLPQRGFGWSPLESWRASKYLYIRAPQPELYDLSVDPGATHNLAQSSKATLDTMASQLDQFDRHFSGGAGKKSSELSSSEMQKLASLGYIGLQKTSGTGGAVAGIDPKEKDKIAIANKVIAATMPAQPRPEMTIPVLNPIVAADPNIFLAQYGLGVALEREKKYAEAVKHLHKAIELQPDSAWAHYEMGTTLLKAGDFKTATTHLEIAAERLPNFDEAHLALAEAYDHSGRTDDAKRERGKSGTEIIGSKIH